MYYVPGLQSLHWTIIIHLFFFKQKTAYEMRISDWSSDVCSSDLLLKPEMYGNVSIRTGRQLDAVVIPSEAVIRSGRREQVFVLRAPGEYEPRAVTIGVSADGMVQIGRAHV